MRCWRAPGRGVRGRGDRVRHHHQRLDREVRLRLPTPAGTRSERPRAGHGMDDLTQDLPSDACADSAVLSRAGVMTLPAGGHYIEYIGGPSTAWRKAWTRP